MALWGLGRLFFPPPAPRAFQLHPGVSSGGPTVRVGTWNLGNFFDTVEGPYGGPVLSRGEWTTKLAALARVIDGLDCDLLAVQEIENRECLEALNERLERPYPHLVLLPGNDRIRGAQVACLSRLPIRRVGSYSQRELPTLPELPRSTRFSRDCLRIDLETEPPIVVLVNHFKSQLPPPKNSALRRRAQALGVVEIAGEIRREYGRERPVLLVAGDLNDQPESWSLRPLFREMVDPLERLPRDLRVTYPDERYRSVLDYLLVDSDQLWRVKRGDVYTEIGRASDHRPVWLEIELSVAGGED